jgi:hypothetical protein
MKNLNELVQRTEKQGCESVLNQSGSSILAQSRSRKSSNPMRIRIHNSTFEDKFFPKCLISKYTVKYNNFFTISYLLVIKITASFKKVNFSLFSGSTKSLNPDPVRIPIHNLLQNDYLRLGLFFC